jgi:hypothetical protein
MALHPGDTGARPGDTVYGRSALARGTSRVPSSTNLATRAKSASGPVRPCPSWQPQRGPNPCLHLEKVARIPHQAADQHFYGESRAELHRRNGAPADDDAQGTQRVETLRQQIRHLQSELDIAKRAVRADDHELRHRTALLAQQVQALTLDNHRLREQLADRAKVRNLHPANRGKPE